MIAYERATYYERDVHHGQYIFLFIIQNQIDYMVFYCISAVFWPWNRVWIQLVVLRKFSYLIQILHYDLNVAWVSLTICFCMLIYAYPRPQVFETSNPQTLHSFSSLATSIVCLIGTFFMVCQRFGWNFVCCWSFIIHIILKCGKLLRSWESNSPYIEISVLIILLIYFSKRHPH